MPVLAIGDIGTRLGRHEEGALPADALLAEGANRGMSYVRVVVGALLLALKS